jgi:hypothetical protein
MRKYKSALIFLVIISVSVINPFNSLAQDDKAEKRWNFTIAPYIYAPAMNADVIINNNPGNIPSSKLNLGGMLYLEAHSPKWSIAADLMLMDISTDITMNNSGREGTFNVKPTIVGLYFMRRVAPWLEIGLGGRLLAYKMNLQVPAGIILSEIDAESNSEIVDPLIVTRFTFLKTEKWQIALRGDVGAFGLLGYFTWLVNPYAGFKITKVFEVNLGYRVLSLYHDDSENNDRLDLLLYGPQAGLLIHF